MSYEMFASLRELGSNPHSTIPRRPILRTRDNCSLTAQTRPTATSSSVYKTHVFNGRILFSSISKSSSVQNRCYSRPRFIGRETVEYLDRYQDPRIY
ncbi:hypothetical protein FRC19_004800 [Serendipita sp. 401]|nr:hypothetical protein FRC19_004800 [Serendipita sp. 401]